MRKKDEYDIVIGLVADDNAYLSIRLFETGVMSKEETIKRLKKSGNLIIIFYLIMRKALVLYFIRI